MKNVIFDNLSYYFCETLFRMCGDGDKPWPKWLGGTRATRLINLHCEDEDGPWYSEALYAFGGWCYRTGCWFSNFVDDSYHEAGHG